MRLLLVADIHSNWAALRSLHESYDAALFLGDLVEYGVEPAPCIEWVRQHCVHAVRGNHDHGAAHGVVASPAHNQGFKYLTRATRPLSRERLTESDRRFLAELPLTTLVGLDDLRIMLVHATPHDPLDEFAPPDPDFWAKRLQGIDVDVVCVGHTHRPYALQVNNTLVVNPGSIGLQRDGDPRASYAVLDGGSVELKRFEYPIGEAVRAVEATTLPNDVKYLLAHVYHHGMLPVPTNGHNQSEVMKSTTLA